MIPSRTRRSFRCNKRLVKLKKRILSYTLKNQNNPSKRLLKTKKSQYHRKLKKKKLIHKNVNLTKVITFSKSLRECFPLRRNNLFIFSKLLHKEKVTFESKFYFQSSKRATHCANRQSQNSLINHSNNRCAVPPVDCQNVIGWEDSLGPSRPSLCLALLRFAGRTASKIARE